MDALAVEAVKSWQEAGQNQQEIVTLGIYYDRDEAQTEVDTYVDLAEGEGIQAAMSRATVLADAHAYPGLVGQADELGLHINEAVSYGNMFQQGPPDPFLSEREITLAAQAYTAEHPPQHKLALEVLPIHDERGQTLGHSLLAIDAVFRSGEDTQDLGQAQSAIGYELAHFEDQASAEDYKASLSAYLDKRDFLQAGADISPTVDFVRTLGQSNGHAEHWLSPWDMADLSKGEWNLQHQPESFKPLSMDVSVQPAPDLDL